MIIINASDPFQVMMSIYIILTIVLASHVVIHMWVNKLDNLLGFNKFSWFIAIVLGGIIGFGLYLYWFYVNIKKD